MAHFRRAGNFEGHSQGLKAYFTLCRYELIVFKPFLGGRRDVLTLINNNRLLIRFHYVVAVLGTLPLVLRLSPGRILQSVRHLLAFAVDEARFLQHN